MAYILKPSDYIEITNNDETQTIIKGISHKNYDYNSIKVPKNEMEQIATISIQGLSYENVINDFSNFKYTTISNGPVDVRYEYQLFKGTITFTSMQPINISDIIVSSNINYKNIKKYNFALEKFNIIYDEYQNNSKTYNESFDKFLSNNNNISSVENVNQSESSMYGNLGLYDIEQSNQDKYGKNPFTGIAGGIFTDEDIYIKITQLGVTKFRIDYSIPYNVFLYEWYRDYNPIILKQYYYNTDITVLYSGYKLNYSEGSFDINKVESKENIFNRNSNELFSTNSYIEENIPFYETQGRRIIENNSFMRGTLNISLKSLIFTFKFGNDIFKNKLTIGDEVKILTIKEMYKNKQYGSMKYFYKNSIYEIINIHTRFDGGFIYDITLAQKKIIE